MEAIQTFFIFLHGIIKMKFLRKKDLFYKAVESGSPMLTYSYLKVKKITITANSMINICRLEKN
jgi:hypothetical protein